MIITSTYQQTPDTAQMGGKGSNLLLLKQAGYPVPDFVIVPVRFFDEARKTNSLHQDVAKLIADILSHFKKDTLFAVRSSATVEDSKAYSFAGQFKTLLNITEPQMAAAIIEVWESVQQKNVQAYMQHAGIDNLKMAVVIQEMIPAEVAGVGFGIHPLTGNREEHVINLVAGSGEALVSGAVTADSYTVRDNIITPQHIADEPLLGDDQLLAINSLLSELGSVFGQPQDIEFAFAEDRLFLLQSRPVTTQHITAKKIIWDNSNIIESYPDLTLPLTFSFIEKMYGAVYKQLSGVLGISAKKVKAYEEVYDNMLGLLNGRVYYNLNSWYKTLSLLPGYKLNAAFMEKMMGVKDRPDIDVREGEQHTAGVRDHIDIVRATMHILYNAFTVRKQKKEFIAKFDAIYNRFKSKDYSKAGPGEIWSDYLEFEQLMSAEWKAPLVNDFFAMIYFGVLQKLCTAYAPEHKDLHNKLIAASKDVITTEPLRLLPELAGLLAKDEALEELFRTQNAARIWEELQKPEYRQQLDAVYVYLEQWGERCVAELKLETITYTQSPELLIAVLQKYIVDDIHYSPAVNHTREEADELMQEKLRHQPLKKRIFNHVLSQARYLISYRENLRFYRTRGFGMVRKMMLAIGEALHQQGVINNARDVFYLQLDELEAVSTTGAPKEKLADIIARRKKDYALFEQLPLPERIITQGKQSVILRSDTGAGERRQKNELQGIPCSGGIVVGKVCKVTTASGNFPNRQVMATYATDPGYVVMFPAVSGILTERGSLLSHAAIVSREMGIPCIVGIEGLMEQLKDGDEIIMDGSTGIVKIPGH